MSTELQPTAKERKLLQQKLEQGPPYRGEVEHLSADFFTITEDADAYEELGMQVARLRPRLRLSMARRGGVARRARAMARAARTSMQYSVSERFRLTEVE